MLNKNIKNFFISGLIKDEAIILKSRKNYERLLLQQMKDKGYVPVLDMDPQWQIVYNEKKDHYSFQLIMFGVYLGKKKCLDYLGFSGQKFIKG